MKRFKMQSNRDKQGEKVYELDKRKTENKW